MDFKKQPQISLSNTGFHYYFIDVAYVCIILIFNVTCDRRTEYTLILGMSDEIMIYLRIIIRIVKLINVLEMFLSFII